ncbi:MAG: AAA family ATPase [Polyangiaceae bacterium]|nr:AAA family ATPase [Polyangiaceae bacterium]
MKKFRPAIGYSDFRELREAGLSYVDKTSFITEILDDSSKVLLFPRPRRFGKTINLSMLGHFLRKTNEDLLPLFAGLEVTKNAETMAHFQQYPVIFATFKDVKAKTFADALDGIRAQIVTAYREHRYLLDENKLDATIAREFQRVLTGEATANELQYAFFWLSKALHEHHGKRAVILIDEYDTPVQSGYAHGFFDDVVLFFRNFFSACLKDNSALFKSVLTGILRVSKENMFSGLNHIDVRTILHEPYSTSFGFTEDEVASIVEPAHLEEVRSWYNGYVFGGHVIYNPWSILHYIKNGVLEPYWVNTASNELIERLALKEGLGLSDTSAALLNGGTIDVQIDSNIVLRDIDRIPEAFWNFLLFAGYLKVVDLQLDMGRYHGKLAIPNREVNIVYQDLFRMWLAKADPTSDDTKTVVKALLAGDAATVQESLGRILLTAMSYYDAAGAKPEKLYHGFVLGLLVHLEKQYEIRSNRESGYGRADMIMRPRTSGRPGVVIEFKVLDSPRKTVDGVLKEGAQQVRELRYASELAAAGASPVYEYVMTFDGKQTWVKRVEEVLGEASSVERTF